jgi:hypothetical protein
MSDIVNEPTNASVVNLYPMNVHADSKVLFGYGCGATTASQLSVIYSSKVIGSILS